MNENAYRHLTELDAPREDFRRRVWFCPATGLYVKTHATPQRRESFDRLSWRITGSLCDAKGKALRDGGKPLIDKRGHVFVVASEETVRPLTNAAGEALPAPSAEAMAEKMLADYEAAHRFVVAKIEEAALKRQAAKAAGL